MAFEDALREPHVGPFDITGKSMRGWILVTPEGVAEDDSLQDWVRCATKFVGTLPAK